MLSENGNSFFAVPDEGGAEQHLNIWREGKMGKFTNLLLCTDLDDTLLTDDKRVSEENRRAIEYFKSEGGLFTFATGRVPKGARPILEQVQPNAPMVCFNGAGIYDVKKQQLVWTAELDEAAVEAVEYVDKTFPFSGIEICTEREIYFCKMNRLVQQHKELEHFPDNNSDYHDVPRPWTKVLFIQEEEYVPQVRQALLSSPFTERYEFIQSSPYYYEMLPKGASKGAGLLELAKLMKIPAERTIAIGDNENDLSLINDAGVGVAVKNAVPEVLEAADYITVDNNSSAVSAVIAALSRGSISI